MFSVYPLQYLHRGRGELCLGGEVQTLLVSIVSQSVEQCHTSKGGLAYLLTAKTHTSLQVVAFFYAAFIFCWIHMENKSGAGI